MVVAVGHVPGLRLHEDAGREWGHAGIRCGCKPYCKKDSAGCENAPHGSKVARQTGRRKVCLVEVKTVIVAAGIVIEAGRVLLTRRKDGAHLAGMWEFPGGKVEPGEDPRVGLARELEEELGITTDVGEIVEVTFHRYEENAVLLLFFEARRKAGSPEPRAIDVAELAWANELDDRVFPPADVAVLARVRTLLGGSP
jgi:8-oxo-dGTP diphosphatase